MHALRHLAHLFNPSGLMYWVPRRQGRWLAIAADTAAQHNLYQPDASL